MVLTTRRFFDQTYDATTFTGANGPTILAKASACQIVGLIQQLGELSEFASDIYHALSRDTFNAAKRIDHLTDRVTSLENNLTTIDSQLKQMPPALFFDTTVESIWRRTENMAHTFFSEETRPLPLVRLVNETFAPPAIHILNEFAGKDCTVYYSDPAFFFNQWVEEQARRYEEENEANKQRRRKNRRKRKAADPVEVQGIQVKVYDARGKEFGDGSSQQLVASTSQPRRVQHEPSRSFHTSPSQVQIQEDSPAHHHQTIEPHSPLTHTPSHSSLHISEFEAPPPPTAFHDDAPKLDLSRPQPSVAIDDIFQQKMTTSTALAAPPPPQQQQQQQHTYTTPAPPPPQESQQQFDGYSQDYGHIPQPPPPSQPPASLSPPSQPPPPSQHSTSQMPSPPPPAHAAPPSHGTVGGHLPPPPHPSAAAISAHLNTSGTDPEPSPPRRPGGHLPPPPTSNILKPVDTSEPATPSRPPNPMMAGRNDLLSALRGGVGLRKVDDVEKPSPAPSAAGGGGMLDAIRNRPMLRKASVVSQAPPQPRGPAQLSAVMELLERRKAIQESSDDDDSDDDDWA